MIAPKQVIAQHDGPAQGAPARKSFDPGTVAAKLSAQPHSGKVLLQGLNLSQLNAVRRAQARQFSAAIERTPARRPTIADAIFGEAALIIPSIICGLTAAVFIGSVLVWLVHVGNWIGGTRLSNREAGRLALWTFGAISVVATAVLRAKVFRGRR